MPRPSHEAQVRFWRKYNRLTRGGVTALRAVEIAIAEETDASFRAVLETVRQALEEGDSLADAVAAQPEAFSLSVIELLRAAERHGQWDEVIPEIADGLAEHTFE